MTYRVILRVMLAATVGVATSAAAQSSQPATITATHGVYPNLVGNTDRPLRYRPNGADFVIENGQEFFNRPLYGRNTAARVDAGDKPEFTIYLPGRGGNLRLGVRSPARKSKWLFDAARVITRYRPGMMLYEIHDPLLGANGVLNVSVVALDATDGLAVRAEAKSIDSGVELVWAYGGVNGKRGTRDGDIGTERVPISEYFQLKPEFCQNNQFTIDGRRFTLRSKPAMIVGLMPRGSMVGVADANQWASFDALLASVAPTPPARPVVIGHVVLPANGPLFLALQRVSESTVANDDLQTYRDLTTTRPDEPSASPAKVSFIPAYDPDDIPRVFAEAERHYAALRERIAVDTPDPYINAAVGALNLASDAVWDDPQQNIMHGAIAWRTRLLGWRGPSMLDALGWHDRARKYLTYWAAQQNTDPIPAKLPGPDEKANLSRSERALHSNGDLSRSHYDMNLVYIDTTFRHLLWTGDVELARQLWPVIERHLAWERRLFRREFGPEKLPLYEAYADIWASDDIQYSGGGVSYSSAYNCYHNRMAA
ncbi:MAG TPA: DUF4450 domain-containing protein, partial [Tepidisphaeraceae bacterium]|nr:DUF4450 domain-containing protein [Tepidisphaeraceae bacterium]